MNREQIEKAAIQSAKEACDNFEEAFEYANGFVFGAEWRINSVWHGIKEIPKQNECFVVQIGDYSFGTFFMQIESGRWNRWCKDMNFTRWAYLDDLLPERKEGAE